MLSVKDFARSGIFARIAKGEVSLRCEWCGEDLTDEDAADAETILGRVREHSRVCALSSRGPMDDKEIAKGGLLGWFCEWCGEQKIDKSIMGSAKKLKAAREHGSGCKCGPSVGGAG